MIGLASLLAVVVAYVVHELRVRAELSSRLEFKKLQLVEAQQRVDVVKNLINLVPAGDKSKELDEIRKTIASVSQELAGTTLETELRLQKVEAEKTLSEARKLLQKIKAQETSIGQSS